MNFSSILGKYTRPEDSIKLGSFESRPDDIELEPQQNKYGHTIHAMPKELDGEVSEILQLLNNCSPEAQKVVVQKIVKCRTDWVQEFLTELH